MQNKFPIPACAKTFSVALCIFFISCLPLNPMFFLSVGRPAGAVSKSVTISEKPVQLAQVVSPIKSRTKELSAVDPFDNLRHEYLGYPKTSPSFTSRVSQVRKVSEPTRNPFDALRAVYLNQSSAVRPFPEEKNSNVSQKMRSLLKNDKGKEPRPFEISRSGVYDEQGAKQRLVEEQQRAFEQERQAIEFERHKQLVSPPSD